MTKVIASPEEMKDVFMRIVFRSLKFTHDVGTSNLVSFVLSNLHSKIRFLKSIEGLTVKEALKKAEGAVHISKRFKEIGIYISGYKEEILELIAENFLNKYVLFYIEKSKEGLFIRPALVPKLNLSSSEVRKYVRGKIPLSQKSEKVQEALATSLEDILRQELKKDWKRIMKMQIGRGLIREGSMKSWPVIRDTIYLLYNILLPLYPSRAHIYGLKEWKGEKAKFPKALLKDLLELLKESFPEDLKDLTEGDVISCIQYREGKKFYTNK